jgi:O-antigen/teichoic acid export membrane protein
LLPGVRNRWHLERNAAGELMHFGKWIVVASVLGFFVNSGERLLLNGMVDVTVLGYYIIATRFVGAVEGVLLEIMTNVFVSCLERNGRGRSAI